MLDIQIISINKNILFRRSIKVTEKEPRSLVEVLKEYVKYLEANDPHNETLEVLRQHISGQDWKILPA